MTKANVLYFEGAGWDFHSEEQTSQSDVGNFRIRTSFFNNEGEQYYIEMGRSVRYNEKRKVITEFALGIDHLFKVEDKNKEELYPGSYEIKTDFIALRELDYSKQGITEWINENLNCNFDTIEVLCSFYGYRVHADGGLYNVMEDIELNHERAIARKEAYNKIDIEYRTLLNEKYSKIGMNEMNSESIVIRCHASKEALKSAGLERVVTIPVEYTKEGVTTV